MPTNSKEQSSRPDLYVIARLIKNLRDGGRTNRTTLATSCGLAYDRLVRYLDWMNEKGFIEIDEKCLVTLTPLGLETYDELVKWILRHVGRLRFPKLAS